MKKFVALLLCAVTLLGLCSCGAKKEKTVDTVMKNTNPPSWNSNYEDYKGYADGFENLLSTVINLDNCHIEEDKNMLSWELIRTYDFDNSVQRNVSCSIKLSKKSTISSSLKNSEYLYSDGWEYVCDTNGYDSSELMARDYMNSEGEVITVYFIPHQNGIQSSNLDVAGFSFVFSPEDLAAEHGPDFVMNENITRTTSFEDIVDLYGIPDEIIFSARYSYFEIKYNDGNDNTLIFKFDYY